MSVLIKGMEMPKNCAECYLNHDAICSVNNCMVIDDCYERKATWCPIIELQPHSRLIDANALLDRFEKESKAADEHGRNFSFSFKRGNEPCAEWWTVEQMVEDAILVEEKKAEGKQLHKNSVVRCRDCGHWNKTSKHMKKTDGSFVACCAWFSRHYGSIETNENDFCSYGYSVSSNEDIPENIPMEYFENGGK